MDRPEAKGGQNKGPMGGEAMLMGLGGCFMSNPLAAAVARNGHCPLRKWRSRVIWRGTAALYRDPDARERGL